MNTEGAEFQEKGGSLLTALLSETNDVSSELSFYQ